MIEEAKRKRDAVIAQHKSQVHDSETKMTKVLTGNKSYKEDDILSYTDLVEYKMVEKPATVINITQANALNATCH